jgi:hypothetical protein
MFVLRRFERILNRSGYQNVELTFCRGKKLEFHVMLLIFTRDVIGWNLRRYTSHAVW